MANHGRSLLLVAEALALEKSLLFVPGKGGGGVTGRDIDTLSDFGSNSPSLVRGSYRNFPNIKGSVWLANL